MGNVGKRIFKLFGVQRAQTPVGKAAAFVQLNAENGFDQIFVADRFAEAEDLSGRLRVEQRFGNETGLMVNDFDVLAAGVEDFDHFRVVQHGKKGFQLNSGRQRVDDGGCVRRGDLNQAEFGVVGFFAQKLQVYGNERLPVQLLTEAYQFRGVFNQFHKIQSVVFKLLSA